MAVGVSVPMPLSNLVVTRLWAASVPHNDTTTGTNRISPTAECLKLRVTEPQDGQFFFQRGPGQAIGPARRRTPPWRPAVAVQHLRRRALHKTSGRSRDRRRTYR